MNRNFTVGRIIIWSVILLLSTSIFISCCVGWRLSWNPRPWSSSSGQQLTVNQKEFSAADSESVQEIEIKWESGRVQLLPSDSGYIRVEQRARETLPQDRQPTIELNAATGKLTISGGRSGFEWLHWFNWFFHNENSDLDVYLPVRLYNSLTVSTSSADIEARADVQTNFLSLSTVSGGITNHAVVQAEKAEVSTTSGDMHLGALRCDGSVRISTTSGEITGDDLRVRNLDISTVSGDAKLTESADTDGMDTVKLDTTSGEIQLNCRKLVKQLNANGVSGEFGLSLPGDITGFTANLDSVSGDFETDFTVQNSGNSYIYGEGQAADYSFHTVSGDVSVNKS